MMLAILLCSCAGKVQFDGERWLGSSARPPELYQDQGDCLYKWAAKPLQRHVTSCQQPERITIYQSLFLSLCIDVF